MESSPYDLCAYCPRLCRHVCPVAVGSAREAATPTAMMAGPWVFARGEMEPELALAFASLCVECGACTAACMIERPVTELLRAARAELAAPVILAPVGAVEGQGQRVAVESDPRRWSLALAGLLGQPVARLRTEDHLGRALLDHPEPMAAHLHRLRNIVEGRILVVSEAASAEVAEKAGIPVERLDDLLPPSPRGPVYQPCRGPRIEGEHAPSALACCGAAGPLRNAHPTIAAEVGRDQAQRLGPLERYSPDSRCATWLRSFGTPMHDSVDRLLLLHPPRLQPPPA